MSLVSSTSGTQCKEYTTLPASVPLAIRGGLALVRRCPKCSGGIRFVPVVVRALTVRDRCSMLPGAFLRITPGAPRFAVPITHAPFCSRWSLLSLPPRRPRWRGRRRRPLRPRRHPSLFSNRREHRTPLPLSSRDPCIAVDVAAALNWPPSSISHHLTRAASRPPVIDRDIDSVRCYGLGEHCLVQVRHRIALVVVDDNDKRLSQSLTTFLRPHPLSSSRRFARTFIHLSPVSPRPRHLRSASRSPLFLAWRPSARL